MVKVREKILRSIGLVLKLDDMTLENVEDDDSLRALGLNSLNYVQVMVMIEKECNIEFEENEMILENIETIGKVYEVVQKKIESLSI